MRFLVKVNIPVEAGNQAARAGKLGSTIQSILARIEIHPVMIPDDLARASGAIETAAKKYS